jgi:hypothetical protein
VAELRSFIIGVTIAGIVLLVAGLAFGLFGDDSSGSPSVRLLGTPPATRTPPPAATRDPSQITPVATVETPVVVPGGETTVAGTVPAGETPGGIATATATLEVAPTEAPTATPEVNTVQVYIDEANAYTPGLVAQLDYLIGRTGSPDVGNEGWRNDVLVSAQDIQTRASVLAGIAAPGCVAGAHGTLVAAANQASSAAGAAASAASAQDAGAASAASGSLGDARSAVNSAVGEVSAAIGGC